MNEPECPIIFQYREITEQAVPGIRPGYLINVFGNIYNPVSHRYKDPYLAADQRYYCTELIKKDGSRVHIQAHRLIMLVFRYFPGCENLEVNHKDGNKHNNSLFNLEWTTHQENMDHASSHFLVAHGENHQFAKLTAKQVHEICKLLEGERYINQFAEIAAKFDVAPVTILEIAYGYSWKEISSQYNIDYNAKLNNRFTKEQVHEICKIIQDFGYYDHTVLKYIIDKLGLTPSDTLRTRIARIYRRDPGYFYYISSQYKW